MKLADRWSRRPRRAPIAPRYEREILHPGGRGEAEASLGTADPHGQRYVIDFDFVRQERTIRVRSTWIVRSGENLPRLTSCYVL
jgi:hypothetical protein